MLVDLMRPVPDEDSARYYLGFRFGGKARRSGCGTTSASETTTKCEWVVKIDGATLIFGAWWNQVRFDAFWKQNYFGTAAHQRLPPSCTEVEDILTDRNIRFPRMKQTKAL